MSLSKTNASYLAPALFFALILFLLISSLLCLGKFTEAEAIIIGNVILGFLTLMAGSFVYLSTKLSVEEEGRCQEDKKLRRYIGWLMVQLNSYHVLKMQNIVRAYEIQRWQMNDPQLISVPNIDEWVVALSPMRLQAQEGSLDLLPLMPTKLMSFIDKGNAEMATITAQIGYIRNTWRERTHELDATKQGQYGLEIKRKLEVVSTSYSNLDNIFRDGLVEADVHRTNVLSRIAVHGCAATQNKFLNPPIFTIFRSAGRNYAPQKTLKHVVLSYFLCSAISQHIIRQLERLKDIQ